MGREQTKEIVILEELKKHGYIMNIVDLYQSCLGHDEFKIITKRGSILDPSYTDTFDFTIREMEKSGKIFTRLLPNNKRVVVMTKKGDDYYTSTLEPKKYARRLLRRYRVFLFRYAYTGCIKERDKELLEAIKNIDTNRTLISVGARVYFLDKQYEHDDGFQRLCSLMTPEQIEKAKKRGEQLYKEYLSKHKEELARYSENVVGHCMFCGSKVTSREAETQRRLLEKFGGAPKTGLVCCLCYSHLKFVEKYLGGEIFETRSNTGS